MLLEPREVTARRQGVGGFPTAKGGGGSRASTLSRKCTMGSGTSGECITDIHRTCLRAAAHTLAERLHAVGWGRAPIATPLNKRGSSGTTKLILRHRLITRGRSRARGKVTKHVEACTENALPTDGTWSTLLLLALLQLCCRHSNSATYAALIRLRKRGAVAERVLLELVVGASALLLASVGKAEGIGWASGHPVATTAHLMPAIAPQPTLDTGPAALVKLAPVLGRAVEGGHHLDVSPRRKPAPDQPALARMSTRLDAPQREDASGGWRPARLRQ